MNDSPASSILQLAFTAHRLGQMADAERLYRQVLSQEPRNFDALRFLGVVLGAGDRAAGIKLLRDALKVRPKSAEAHSDLGALLHADGNFDAAAVSLGTAIRIDPLYRSAYYNFGVVRRDQGRFAEAAVNFAAAIGLEPTFTDGWYNLGVAWQAQGKYDDAIRAYRNAIRLSPTRVEIRCALGGLLFEMLDYSGAADAYREALEIKSDYPVALNGLAATLAQSDDNGALDATERAIQSVPENIYAHTLLGNVLRRLGRFDDAIKAYQAALEMPGNHAETFFGLTKAKKLTIADEGLLGRIQGELDRSGVSLSASDRSYMHFALGKALDDLDRCGEAIRHFDLANKAWFASRPPHKKATSPEVERQSITTEINNLIAGFGAGEIARLRQWGNASERPILIVGMMRSGTTLVEQILASHPDVAAGGELRYWNDCRVKLRIGSGGVLQQAEIESATQNYLEVLDGISPDARRVTDKMPFNFIVLGPIHAMFPNARIIHCRRHPIDTSLSVYFARFNKDQDFTYDRAGIVFFYKEYRRLMAHWRRVLPADRLLDLDYQSMVDDQETTTRRLLDFCGLEWNDGCLSFHKTERPVRTASDWQVRQPIYRSSVERWRRYEPWLGEFRELLTEID